MKYRMKTEEIEVLEYTGVNDEQMKNFVGEERLISNPLETIWWIKSLGKNEGKFLSGYFIIKINGEFYPCNPDLFKATYEKVGGQSES